MMGMHKTKRTRRQGGAALAEYGLIVAGVTMVSLVAVSVFGSKVGALIGTSATLLPGASTDQNAPVMVGQLMETRTEDTNGDGVKEIVVDAARIVDSGGGLVGSDNGTPRLGNSVGGLDPHDTSHLVQQGSRENMFHGN
ncbi:MAG: hypothetical protein P8M78_00280 [Myxococcota bacterium]|nr:hypothetical protein [Myxococcota bacterium]